MSWDVRGYKTDWLRLQAKHDKSLGYNLTKEFTEWEMYTFHFPGWHEFQKQKTHGRAGSFGNPCLSVSSTGFWTVPDTQSPWHNVPTTILKKDKLIFFKGESREEWEKCLGNRVQLFLSFQVNRGMPDSLPQIIVADNNSFTLWGNVDDTFSCSLSSGKVQEFLHSLGALPVNLHFRFPQKAFCHFNIWKMSAQPQTANINKLKSLPPKVTTVENKISF